jgi:hypothetical protein
VIAVGISYGGSSASNRIEAPNFTRLGHSQAKTKVAYRNVNFDFKYLNTSVTPTVPSNLTISFGDGSSSQTVWLSGATVLSIIRISHRYATSGSKVIGINDGTTTHNQTIEVRSNSFGSQYVYKKPDLSEHIVATSVFSPPCTQAYLPLIKDKTSSSGSGMMHVRFGQGNITGKIRRPVIFVEGVDFDDDKVYDPQNGKLIRSGGFGWDNVTMGISEIIDDEHEDSWDNTQRMPIFVEELYTKGYDLILLDFDDGADYMQKNADVLIQMIRRINADKRTISGCLPSIVVAASMGGQVAKYALAKMEKDGENHDTQMYCSFDSPHKGASIPLSIQGFAWFLSHYGSDPSGRDGNKDFWEKRLSRPAAQQLLVHHLSQIEFPNGVAPCNLRTLWLTELESLNAFKGYPQKTVNIAASNGSALGQNQGFGTNGVLLDYCRNQNLAGINLFRARLSAAGANSTLQLPIPGTSGLTATQNNNIAYVRIPSGFAFDWGKGLNYIAWLFTGSNLPSSYNELFLSKTANNGIIARVQKLNVNGEIINSNVFTNSTTFNHDMTVWDNAPGCSRKDVSRSILPTLKQSIGGTDACNISVPATTFMPTTSTFDINTGLDNVNFSFTGIDPDAPNFAATPFKRLWWPTHDKTTALNNEQHVTVSQSLTDWLFTQITNTTANIGATIGNNQEYNYGDMKKRLPTTTVQSGGRLFINALGATGYRNEANASQTNFEVSTSGGCGNIITVESGGLLALGENWVNSGKLSITNGDQVIISGTLKANNASQIIVESGGRLTINAGATVNLVGANSIITVKDGGELIINGNLTPLGNGYIRLERGNIFTMSNTAFITNPLILRGTGISNRLIYLAGAATLELRNTGRLSLQNCLVEGEAVSYAQTPLERIIVRPNCTLQVADVKFKENSSVGQKTFIVFDNSTGNIHPFFERCQFDVKGTAIDLRAIAVNTGNFGTATIEISGGIFSNGASVKVERAQRIFILDSKFEGGGSIIAANILQLRLGVEMRGNNTTGVGVKIQNVVETRLIGGFIDSYTLAGIDASTGINGFVDLSEATIQNCFYGIWMNGGVNHPYDNNLGWSTNYGFVGMTCSRLINNHIGIFGNNLLFEFARDQQISNIFRRNLINDPDSRLFDIIYGCHRPAMLLFFYMYIDGAPATITPVNNLWRFRESGCNPSRTPQPYGGDILTDDDVIFTDPTVTPVIDCGGLTLRGRFKDPLDSACVIKVNGVGRNLKVQYDAAMKKMKSRNTEEAVALFTNLASLQNSIRDTASRAVKHIISVARIFSGATAISLRSANDGWLPETLVEFPKEIIDNQLIISPNPANTTVQMELRKSDYHVNVSNTVGQSIFSVYTEGSLSIDVSKWTNGIYLFEVTDKATNKRQRSKIVVQH